MISFTIDSLLVISVLVTLCGAVCFFSKYFKGEYELIKKDSDLYFNEKIPLKKITSQKSFSSFDIFISDSEKELLQNSNNTLSYNSKSCDAIQTSNTCNRCNRKLYKYNSVDYFAFDKQYCKICWQKINYNIVNETF